MADEKNAGRPVRGGAAADRYDISDAAKTTPDARDKQAAGDHEEVPLHEEEVPLHDAAHVLGGAAHAVGDAGEVAPHRHCSGCGRPGRAPGATWDIESTPRDTDPSDAPVLLPLATVIGWGDEHCTALLCSSCRGQFRKPRRRRRKAAGGTLL
jgi:hypothetical protein